jgi:hydrogenase maturation factor HypF (carbamoyltransferase family)
MSKQFKDIVIHHQTKSTSEELKSKINNGYGACKSCNCRGWQPNNPKNNYCKNCGHHWTQHH